MNGSQLINILSSKGLDDTINGHLMVTLDVWTSSIVLSIVHPADDVRSVTILVSTDEISLQEGEPFAGFSPTVYGTPADTWEDLAEQALKTAYLVSTAFIDKMYQEVGFSMAQFMDGVGAGMSFDDRMEHLRARLQHASMRRQCVRRAEMLMDLEGEDAADVQQQLSKGFLDAAWSLVDVAGARLTAVDGQ